MPRLLPVAPDVPDDAHRLVPAAAFRADTAAIDPLACPHTGVVCPALGRLFGGGAATAGASAAQWADRIRPCASCRVAFDADVSALRGLRLGQREREVLLGAMSCGNFVVTSAGMSRSLSAARRRAAQTLTRAGLVAAATDPDSTAASLPSRPDGKARAAVTLSPLGTYVLAAFGRFLTAGKPVRWTRPLAGVLKPGRDPQHLVEEAAALAQSALRETLRDLTRVLVAAVARPVRDAAALDAVTRQLESKAQGLRALLERDER